MCGRAIIVIETLHIMKDFTCRRANYAFGSYGWLRSRQSWTVDLTSVTHTLIIRPNGLLSCWSGATINTQSYDWQCQDVFSQDQDETTSALTNLCRVDTCVALGSLIHSSGVTR